MIEYRVLKCAIRNAQAEMNRMATDGWPVIRHDYFSFRSSSRLPYSLSSYWNPQFMMA